MLFNLKVQKSPWKDVEVRKVKITDNVEFY